MVPDHSGRGPLVWKRFFSSPWADAFFSFVLRLSFGLGLGMAFDLGLGTLALLLQAGLECLGEVIGSLAATNRRDLDALAAPLGLDQLQHPLAIFVVIF